MRNSTISSFFLFNRANKPLSERPADDQITLCKIMYYYPQTNPVYQQQSHVGLAQGLIMFSQQFSQQPLQSIHTEKFTHILLQCQPQIWLSMIFQHPSQQSKLHQLQSYQYKLQSLTRSFYQNFYLFHGPLQNFRYPEDYPKLQALLRDYTIVFLYQIGTKDQLFEGFYYCPIDRKSYMLMLFLMNSLVLSNPAIQHTMVTFDGHLVSTSLLQPVALNLYSYFCRAKQWKRLEQLNRQPDFQQCLYGRILGYGNIGYIYGHGEQIFAPIIYFNNSQYRLVCWVNQGLQLILLCENQEYDSEFFVDLGVKLEQLSNQLVGAISPQLQRSNLLEDNYKFIYFNHMNLAIKISTKLQNIEDSLYRLLTSVSCDMQPAKNKSDSLVRSVMRTHQMWLFAVKVIDSREIFIILPPNAAPANKIEEEVNKFANHYFHNIFTGF